MALKINGTTAVTDTPTLSWNNISGKPVYVSGLIKTFIGDGVTPQANAVCSNATYYSANGSLQLWFDTNCTVNCVCDCGGGDGDG